MQSLTAYQETFSPNRILSGIRKAPWFYVFFLLAPFLIYWPFLGNWFYLLDDGHTLQQAVRYSPWQYFTQPHAYLLLSHTNLTPWLTLSYDFDYTLFGINPLPFHIHQLISIGIAAVLSFHVLRRYQVSRSLSAIGLLLFLASPSVANIASGLPARHYIEGMIFALVCLIAFLNAQSSRHRYGWLILSLSAYALCTLAKEIYVPFPVILFALAPGNLPRRARRVIPFLLVTGLYIGYRFYMLGGFGGYNANPGHFFEGAYHEPPTYATLLKFPLFIFRSEPVAWLATLLTLGLVVHSLLRRKANGWLLTCTFAAVMTPLFFLLPQIHMYGTHGTNQWYTAAVWSFCLLIPAGILRIDGVWLRTTAACTLGVILVLTLWQVTVPRLQKNVTFSSHVAKHIWEARQNQFIMRPKFTMSVNIATWRYLTYLVKGKPGTSVITHKAILHWAPQKSKQGIRIENGEAKRIPYPNVSVHPLSREKKKQMLEAMYIRHKVLYFNCDDSSKRVFFLVEKPFQLAKSYTCYFTPTYRIKRNARQAGIDLNKAYFILGEKIDGVWRYSQPIPYGELQHRHR